MQIKGKTSTSLLWKNLKNSEFLILTNMILRWILQLNFKQSQRIIKNCSIFRESDGFTLTVMNPQLSKLYSLIKLQKENHSIRPVVSYVNVPADKFSRKIINIIQYHCKFQTKFNIKNSAVLVENIKDLYIPEILLYFHLM